MQHPRASVGDRKFWQTRTTNFGCTTWFLTSRGRLTSEACKPNSQSVALLEILKFPDERLRHKTLLIQHIDEEIRVLVANMTETMYAARGAGLAAIQVGVQKRLFLVDATIAGGKESDPPLVFINPVVVAKEGRQDGDEGCLSFPGVFIPVKRAMKVTASAMDLEMREFSVTAEQLFARAIQHEIDHLDAKLLIDFAGPVKRRMIKRRMERREWENEEQDQEGEVSRQAL